MRSIFRFTTAAYFFIGFVVFAGGCSGGCKPGMKAFDVNLEVGPGLHNQTVVVDLTGVSTANEDDWSSVSLDQYFSTTDSTQFRQSHRSQGLIHTMEFRAGDGEHTATLSRNDPIWQTWEAGNASWLYIVTQAGAANYKKRLPLDKCRWDKETETLNIRITPAGISPQEAPLPMARE